MADFKIETMSKFAWAFFGMWVFFTLTYFFALDQKCFVGMQFSNKSKFSFNFFTSCMYYSLGIQTMPFNDMYLIPAAQNTNTQTLAYRGGRILTSIHRLLSIFMYVWVFFCVETDKVSVASVAKFS